MKSYLIILAMLLSMPLMAQLQSPRDRVSGNPLDQFTWHDLSDKSRSFGQPSKEYDGTPYFIDEWKKATLQTIDNKNYIEITLKLDLFNKRILYKDKITGDSTIIVDEFVREFILEDEDTSYHFQKVLTNRMKNYTAFNFLILLVDGEYALMLKPEKRLISESTSSGLVNSTGTLKDEFRDLYTYFIYSRKDRKLAKLKPNLKSLIKILDGHEYDLRNYVESQNLDLQDRDQLIAVMSYYNSLN